MGCVRNWVFVQRWCLDAEFSRLSYTAINGSVNEFPYSSQKSHLSVYVEDTTMTLTENMPKRVCAPDSFWLKDASDMTNKKTPLINKGRNIYVLIKTSCIRLWRILPSFCEKVCLVD